MWDHGWGFGLLKGELFQSLLEKSLGPVKTIEDCPIPLGVTAYNVQTLTTSIRTQGELATAVRASATFPVMFQPVTLDNQYHIDGGLFDQYGLVALPTLTGSGSGSGSGKPHRDVHTVPDPNRIINNKDNNKNKKSKKINASNTTNPTNPTLPPLIVNVLFDNCTYLESMIPPQHRHCRVLTITLNDVPAVNPVSTMCYDGRYRVYVGYI